MIRINWESVKCGYHGIWGLVNTKKYSQPLIDAHMRPESTD